MKSLCVFCGSASGASPEIHRQAKELGKVLAIKNITLVYGGAAIGVMGMLADSCLENGGKVIGVMPQGLEQREISHKKLTELHIVKNMHERKQLMYELSDAFIALPGGFGTLDELFEILTWRQLGEHSKNIGILNIGGFFSPLLSYLENAHLLGFVKKDDMMLFNVSDKITELLAALEKSP